MSYLLEQIPAPHLPPTKDCSYCGRVVYYSEDWSLVDGNRLACPECTERLWDAWEYRRRAGCTTIVQIKKVGTGRKKSR